ncbi:MAG: glutathione S-transferase family protein [Sandaracinobacteroides sp.]
MRLFNSRGPNPQIVRTFLAEKGQDIELVPIDIMGGENRADAFMARNPFGQLPALELDSGKVITEVIAICELLEELHPAPALIGSSPEERAEARMWSRRIDLCVIEPFMAGFRATTGRAFFAPRMPLLSESAGGEMIGLLAGNLRQLDSLLEGRTWVCGDRFTLADILLGSFLLFGAQSGAPLPDGLGWLPDFVARCQQRPSFAA